MSKRKYLGPRRVAALAVGLIALALLVLQPNTATADQESYLQRTGECFLLLLNDLDAHARECAGPVITSPESLVETGPGPGPGPTAPNDSTPPTTPCSPSGSAGSAYLSTIGNAGGGIWDGDNPCPPASFLAPMLGDWIADIAARAPVADKVVAPILPG